MIQPRQLSLLIDLKSIPSIKNFVIGKNGELIDKIKDLSQLKSKERFVYVWGDSGSGKTHLVAASTRIALAIGNNVVLFKNSTGLNLDFLSDPVLIIVDDVQEATVFQQKQLFNMYNECKAREGSLLVFGNVPPSQLRIRKDLLTRLSWGLVFRIHTLSENEKFQAMINYSRQRGFCLPKEVVRYVLTRRPRDLDSLLKTLHGLDLYSIETRRSVTIPLAREFFAIGLADQNSKFFSV